jgi:hypothetical protein
VGTFELLVALTALVLGVGTVTAYQRTGDLLHPMLFLGPLFLYATVLDPWLVRHDLARFFAYQEDVNLVLILNLLGVTALVLGALHDVPRRPKGRPERRPSLQERERAQLRGVAFALAVVALAAYAYGIANSGGFVAAFSQWKGGGQTGSGYIGEAMNLGLVGAVMVALSQYRRRWTVPTVVLLILGLLPNLIQGTFGGRRGPLFLALAAAILGWTITRPRQPRLWVLGGALAMVMLSVAFIGSQRQHLYLGSEDAEVKWDEFLGALQPDEINEGNNFVYGAAFVLATRYSGQFTWGRELAVNLLVRPIPRQFWPTKYEDVGATWVTNDYPGLGHLSVDDWLAAVGWIPIAGSSAISISDLFGDFGWVAVVAMYFIGRGFASLRFRRLTRGGMWDLLHLEALILSIYLATQSFSAFYHRYLILAIPTIIAWQVIMHGRSRTRRLSLRVGRKPMPAQPQVVAG